MIQRAVGANVLRKDGREKVTGAAKYVDDLHFPGMLYGRTIRSTIPRGRIRSIRLDLGADGFTVVDYRDVPGRNVVAVIEDDQPFLAVKEINHVAEPILLLAHADRDTLLAARVEIEYEPLTPIFDPQRSEHVFKKIRIRKGNAERALKQADIVVEGTYRTGSQEHVYIETNGVIAVPEADGITVHGSIQCPYYVHKALKELLGYDDARVRVVQSETGGGFGGKEEYPSIIAGHAALLAVKAGRPVKIIYDRVEDMVATTKRHPSIITHRTGVTRDGKLVAMDVDVLMDGGAYCTLSPVVLSRGCIHAGGPYLCDDVLIHGRVVMTNSPPNGAFRGFGAPQTQFATEVHMERIAERLGMDPVELRRINALKPGDETATGQHLGDDTSALRVLDEAVAASDFHAKREAYRGTNRGIGLSLFFHGSGFTGSGEVHLKSKASVETSAGGARILVASTEIGQGTRTMHAQIVADALGIGFDEVEHVRVDTSMVPDSGPTVASRTCMVVGEILRRASEELRGKLDGMHPAEHFRLHGPTLVMREYEKPHEVSWDDTEYVGDAYATYGWGCDVVEVEIDPDTCEARPLRVVTAQDIGRAIHPMLVAGQIEGGTAQGIGWALNENVVTRDGAMLNAQLTNYTIPTTLDTPPMEVILVENPSRYGPYGAKGVGEMPIDGPAAAVVNAIRDAGLDVREIPAIPEALMRAPALENLGEPVGV